MIKVFTSIALMLSAGCSAHAHAPVSHPPAARHSTPAPVVTVSAWVWIGAHYTPHGWVHGHWAIRTVPRHMLSRHPRTHVRYVQGRHRPHRPPPHRHRHHRHR